MRTKKKNLRTTADGLAGRIAPHVETAREKAGPMLAEARGMAAPRLAEARERAMPLLAEAREKAAPVLEKAGPKLAEAREKAGPLLAEARDKAGPVLAEARDKAAPAVAEVRERFATEVVPVVTAALAAANEATEDAREEGFKRGRAAVAALKGEVAAPEKKRTHRVRNSLLVVGLGGAVAMVAKKLSDRQASTAWQSAYTPPVPAPAAETAAETAAAAGAHRAGADSADDEAGASPDVAVADSAAEPHTPTTPDDPAEEIDLKEK